MTGLFNSIALKGVTLKNRLAMAPMATNMATEEGEVMDRHVKHYATRADRGVGLIIVEHTYVSKDGKLSRGQLGIYDDKLKLMLYGTKKEDNRNLFLPCF